MRAETRQKIAVPDLHVEKIARRNQWPSSARVKVHNHSQHRCWVGAIEVLCDYEFGGSRHGATPHGTHQE